MKCINCDREIPEGIEKCPHCGCHYPTQKSDSKSTEEQTKPIDPKEAEKEIKTLIDTVVFKGYVSGKERKTILHKAQSYKLDVEVIEIMLDAALSKIKEQKKSEKEQKKAENEQKNQELRKEVEEKRRVRKEEWKREAQKLYTKTKELLFSIHKKVRLQIKEWKRKFEEMEAERLRQEEESLRRAVAAEEKARREAEEKARREAEEKAKREAEEQARQERLKQILFCSNCGAPLSPEAMFCSNCGKNKE